MEDFYSNSDPGKDLTIRKGEDVRRSTQLSEGSLCVSSMITLELVSDPAVFHRLKEEWNKLVTGGSKQNFDWVLKANKYQHLQDTTVELAILVARNKGQVVMIWPLMKHYPRGIAQLRFIEDEHGEVCELLLKEHSSNLNWLRRAYTFLLSAMTWDSLNLKSVRAHSLLLAFLREQKALCIRLEDGSVYNCLLARNIAGRAYNSLIQGHSAVSNLYNYIRMIYSTQR